jgi:3',5'-cyclic AMP phosphodiesterase CpdA
MDVHKKKKHTVRKILLTIIAAIVVAIPCKILISNYIESLPKLDYHFGTASAKQAVYPDTKFAVISDTHYYDDSLGTTGSAFEACLESDRKLIKSTAELMDYGVDKIEESGVNFVLVTGDLTKDGELLDHQRMAAELSKLRAKGIKVYVIPGNHDVNNPGAVRYDGDKTIPVDNISAAQFAEIYKDEGYGDAIMRDPSSLSYVAQPQEGLWIVGLDTCRYSENKKGGEETVGGRLTAKEETWLEGVLKEAEAKGNAVIVIEHHGVVEHWTGQSKLHPDYLVSDYKNVGKLLSSYNVRVAFTGHYHAQDITCGDFGQYGSLYDIETGSLATPPCPIRYCSISGGSLSVTSEKIVGEIHSGTSFAKDGETFVRETIYKEAIKTLKGYFVTGSDADYIANAVTDAFIAHYNGDENSANRPAFDENKLSLWGRLIYSQEKYVVDGLWKDIQPSDNNCVIDLNKK